MRAHYDFSKMQGRPNPYAKMLKQAVTIRLDCDTVEYFKAMSEKTGLPYQSLINLYLRECAADRKELTMKWQAPARQAGHTGPASRGEQAGKRGPQSRRDG